jgi:small GTP-binding protein
VPIRFPDSRAAEARTIAERERRRMKKLTNRLGLQSPNKKKTMRSAEKKKEEEAAKMTTEVDAAFSSDPSPRSETPLAAAAMRPTTDSEAEYEAKRAAQKSYEEEQKNKDREGAAAVVGLPASIKCDHRLKLVVVGEAGVGKTSLVLRMCKDRFDEVYEPTLGLDYQTRMFEHAATKRHVMVEVWDTPGQDRFRNQISSFVLRGAHGIIGVYDCTSIRSAEEVCARLDDCLAGARMAVGDLPPALIVVANKLDLYDPEDAKHARAGRIAKDYARMRNTSVFPASAKTGAQVSVVFEAFASACFEARVMPAHLKTLVDEKHARRAASESARLAEQLARAKHEREERAVVVASPRPAGIEAVLEDAEFERDSEDDIVHLGGGTTSERAAAAASPGCSC